MECLIICNIDRNIPVHDFYSSTTSTSATTIVNASASFSLIEPPAIADFPLTTPIFTSTFKLGAANGPQINLRLSQRWKSPNRCCTYFRLHPRNEINCIRMQQTFYRFELCLHSHTHENVRICAAKLYNKKKQKLATNFRRLFIPTCSSLLFPASV